MVWVTVYGVYGRSVDSLASRTNMDRKEKYYYFKNKN